MGKGRKGEKGSPGKLLCTEHFSINYFSEPLYWPEANEKLSHADLDVVTNSRITDELAL